MANIVCSGPCASSRDASARLPRRLLSTPNLRYHQEVAIRRRAKCPFCLHCDIALETERDKSAAVATASSLMAYFYAYFY